MRLPLPSARVTTASRRRPGAGFVPLLVRWSPGRGRDRNTDDVRDIASARVMSEMSLADWTWRYRAEDLVPFLQKGSTRGRAVGAGRWCVTRRPAMSAASVLFSWSPECLRRAVDEVRALESMYGDSASLDNDPTEVSNHHETVLELAESVLDAHESNSRSRRSQSESLASGNKPPDTHAKHDDPLCSVPALEVTIKMLGPRLRGGGVAVAVRLAPGYPLLIRAELHVQGNARVTVADLSFLKQAASAASVECALGETNAVAGVEAVRGALRELNERVTFEQNLESAESAERLMTSKAKELTIDKQQNKKKSTIARRLIWFHHIKAPGKRKAVQQWARELGLVRAFPTDHTPPSRLPILVLRRDYYLCPYSYHKGLLPRLFK